nr:hypothetical protein [Paenibacillus sp. MMS18-CY102]
MNGILPLGMNDQFLITAAGTYLIQYEMRFNGWSDRISARVTVNGAVIPQSDIQSTTSVSSLSDMSIVHLNAGDILSLQIVSPSNNYPLNTTDFQAGNGVSLNIVNISPN